MIYDKIIKRILDLFFSLLLTVILSPVLLIIYIIARAKLGSPVLFRQERPGRDEKIFTLYKFRTMNDARGENGELLPDGERMTGFGNFLRKTSLDELPELLNIIKGEMSFIGPRPLLVRYLERYSAEQARRHDVRPGLTGLAQVSGRNAIDWEQKFEYDVYYVDHISFWLDTKILFRTVGKVFAREGISGEGSATMNEFMGSKDGK